LTLVVPPTRINAPNRLIAIGDLHGDLKAACKVLQLAQAIDENDQWIGEDLVIVQVGDVIDRGANDRAVLDLLEDLARQAMEAGGGLYSLLGNHETMNVCGDFRYVWPQAWADFDEFYDPGPHSPSLNFLPQQMWGRLAAFQPGGVYAQKLSNRNVTMIVGDTVFVHGGLNLGYANYGLERLNQDTRNWMLGKNPQPTFVLDDDGPLWCRRFSWATSSGDCKELSQSLELLQCKRMVVGHTVQDIGINSTCEQKVWRIDVGLCESYGGPIEILEIRGNNVNVLRS